jgi:hypothetical protein
MLIGGICLAIVASGLNFWIAVAVFAFGVVADVASHIGLRQRGPAQEQTSSRPAPRY